MREIATVNDLMNVWNELKVRFDRNPFLAFEFIEQPEETLRSLGYRLHAPARAALLASLPV